MGWEDRDAYQQAFERLLRDLKAENVTQLEPVQTTILYQKASTSMLSPHFVALWLKRFCPCNCANLFLRAWEYIYLSNEPLAKVMIALLRVQKEGVWKTMKSLSSQ